MWKTLPSLCAAAAMMASAAQGQTVETIARCFHDTLYLAPELFPPQNVPPAWQVSDNAVQVIWYGASFAANGTPIRVATVTFASDGTIGIRVARHSNILDQAVVETSAPASWTRARIEECSTALSLRAGTGQEPSLGS